MMKDACNQGLLGPSDPSQNFEKILPQDCFPRMHQCVTLFVLDVPGGIQILKQLPSDTVRA